MKNPCLQPIRIDINDYIYTGEGASGAGYFHKTDPTLMLKLYTAASPYEIIVNELLSARKVYDLGIPTPEPGDFITDGNGRYGIRFKRIQDKKSFSRAVGDEPQRVEFYAREFAGMCLELHSVHVDCTQFPNMKDVYLQMLKENPYFNMEERKWVKDFLSTVPDTDTALHGDLQYSNAILSESGRYFIDLGDFAYGHPYFDIGQVMLCCLHSPEAFIRETFHMEPETAKAFWKYFVKGYFGEQADVEETTRIIRPYSGLKTLLIERNTGSYHPHFHQFLG